MSLSTFLRNCGGLALKFSRATSDSETSDSDTTAYSLLGYHSEIVGEVVIGASHNVVSVWLASSMRFGTAKPVIDLCRPYGIVVDVK